MTNFKSCEVTCTLYPTITAPRVLSLATASYDDSLYIIDVRPIVRTLDIRFGMNITPHTYRDVIPLARMAARRLIAIIYQL